MRLDLFFKRRLDPRCVTGDCAAGRTLFMPSILAIDDHGLFRAGLGLLVRDALPTARFEAVGSIEAALERRECAPDLILLDLKLGGLSGLDGLPLLRARWPGCKVVIISSEMDSDLVEQAVARGAAAFASKGDTSEQIVELLLALLADELKRAEGEPGLLTARQREILRLLEAGASNKAIARALNISEFTVRGHVQKILRTLGAESRTGAVFNARRSGML